MAAQNVGIGAATSLRSCRGALALEHGSEVVSDGRWADGFGFGSIACECLPLIDLLDDPTPESVCPSGPFTVRTV